MAGDIVASWADYSDATAVADCVAAVAGRPVRDWWDAVAHVGVGRGRVVAPHGWRTAAGCCLAAVDKWYIFIGNITFYNSKAKHSTSTAINTIFQAPHYRRLFEHF